LPAQQSKKPRFVTVTTQNVTQNVTNDPETGGNSPPGACTNSKDDPRCMGAQFLTTKILTTF
jgi:hypothetical protein